MFSELKFPLTSVSILPTLASRTLIVTFVASSWPILAFPACKSFIWAEWVTVNFSIDATFVVSVPILTSTAVSLPVIVTLWDSKLCILALTAVKSVILATFTSKSDIWFVFILSIVEPSIVPLSVVILSNVSAASWNSVCLSSKLSIVLASSIVSNSCSSGCSTILTILCLSLNLLSLDIRFIVSPNL